MSDRKRIGIMGGTFNPIHNGHLMIAREAKQQYDLHKILFMPSGVSYQKRNEEIAPSALRAEMTALAIANISYFELSNMEIERKGNTYSYETVEELNIHHPECDYFFIIGADTLFSLETWRQPERLFYHCTILAAARGDVGIDKINEQVNKLTQKFNGDIRTILIKPNPVSSTMIRNKVRKGESIQSLVPENVRIFIEQNKLYLN